jgi:hypothetical protein
MTNARQDGLYLVVLGALVFVLTGSVLESAAPVSAADFRVVYYSARCLLEHRDPYNQDDLKYIYHAEGGETPKDTPILRLTEIQYIYPPTAFVVTLPFAFLPFGYAHLLWLALTASSFVLASFAIWDIGAVYAPVLSGAMVCLCLMNGELFLVLGNPAGIAISLCVVAVCCFLQERLVWLGILCLVVSLMLKPHDAALVWVYLLLGGPSPRKRSLQVLLVILLLSLPILVWVTYVAPHWLPEFRSNLVANSTHGGLSDPGPSSMAAHGIGMIISLQSILTLVKDDPTFYNPVTYLLCGVLFTLWLVRTLRGRFSPAEAWFALAPIATLSMLPIYHRIYDAKLLLLVIPASAMLWIRGGPIAWMAAVLNAAAFLFTGGIPWAAFLSILKHVRIPATPLSHAFLIILQVAPVPFILLVMSLFYLYVFWHRSSIPNSKLTRDDVSAPLNKAKG